jgi:signal transduction histidine kinase
MNWKKRMCMVMALVTAGMVGWMQSAGGRGNPSMPRTPGASVLTSTRSAAATAAVPVARPGGSRSLVLIGALSLMQCVLIGALVSQHVRRRRPQPSLQEQEDQLWIPALPSNMALWRWCAQSDEIWGTPSLREIVDLPEPAPVTRMNIREHVYPADRETFDDLFTLGWDGEFRTREFRIQSASGQTRWLSAKARRRQDATASVYFATGVMTDITEQKQAESRYQQQRLQLAHLTRVAILGQLSGALAHELTQPLTSILSNAQAAQRFLSARDVDLTEVRTILADIITDDVRAGDVIRRLRALLKRGETQFRAVDVSRLLQDVLMLLHGDLTTRQVEVTTLIEEDLPQVQADRVQVQQVMLNLLMNASEAMMSNAPEERRISISASLQESGVHFAVMDCGTGMTSEQLESVFDAFYTTKSNGLGLGLAICRSIVTAHGGRLWATNNKKRGATFHFTLPLAQVVRSPA